MNNDESRRGSACTQRLNDIASNGTIEYVLRPNRIWNSKMVVYKLEITSSPQQVEKLETKLQGRYGYS